MENALETVPTPKPRRRRKWMRRFGWSAVGLVVLYGLLVGVENWRGDRAWKHYLADMEAKGEPISAETLLPPPVPDEENFAMAPLFRPFLKFEATPGTQEVKWHHPEAVEKLQKMEPLGKFSMDRPRFVTWRDGELIDLQKWQNYFRGVVEFPKADEAGEPGRDVLVALSRFDAEFAGLREAAARPQVQTPRSLVDHQPAYLAYLGSQGNLAQLAMMRSLAELSIGEVNAAFETLKLILRLAESPEADGLLISVLVGDSRAQYVMDPLWHGLVQHRWSDAQLLDLQGYFARQNFARAYQYAVRGERVLFAIPSIDNLARDRMLLKTLPTIGKELGKDLSPVQGTMWNPFLPVIVLSPRGWFEQNKASLGRWHQGLIESVDGERIRFDPDRLEQLEDRLRAPVTLNTRVYASLMRVAGSVALSIQERCAYAQGLNDLALIAITLERHRIRHGRYPAALSEVDSDLLAQGRGIPDDCVTGRPPHYKPEGDSFVLYYEGWNERDDGGKESRASNGRGQIRPKEGDWVWPQLRQP